MTQERIEELEKLCREATEGPWYFNSGCYAVTRGDGYEPEAQHPDFVLIGKDEWAKGGWPFEGRNPDGIFIEESRQALPECLEEIKRLRSALKSISNFIRCDGPQCYDCGNDYEHPLSHEAEIAKKALEK